MVMGRYTFTGDEQDGRTGLQYANACWYDPELARFATQDPERVLDCLNNDGTWDPTKLTAPSGEFNETFLAVTAILAVAAGIKVGVQTGERMRMGGVRAFGINLGIGLISAPMGSVVGQVMSSDEGLK